MFIAWRLNEPHYLLNPRREVRIVFVQICVPEAIQNCLTDNAGRFAEFGGTDAPVRCRDHEPTQ